MELISVVMPIYNGEKFIEKGIESVLSQSYNKVELILVNDGSKDGSLEICRAYEKNDERVRVIDKENGGVGDSRTAGLRAATGEYVAFIDQDDWYDIDALSLLYEKAKEGDADMVIGSYKLVNADGSVRTSWKLDKNLSWTKYRIVAPWGKLYKRSFLSKYDIHFPAIKISEDTYFNMCAISHTDRIDILDKPVYNWLYNEASESRTNWNRISEDRNMVSILSSLWEETKDSEYFKKDRANVVYFFTKHLVWYMLYNRKGNERDAYKKMTKACFDFLDEYFPEYKKWKYTGLFVPKGELLFNRLCVTGSIMLHKLHIL